MAMSRSMANAQAFVKFGRMVKTLRTTYAGNTPRLNAVNRAAVNLMACGWRDYGKALKVQSATTSDRWYWVDDNGCECAATKACWHREAWLLVQAMHDDGSDDNRGAFTDDDSAVGFTSKLEAALPRETPGERAAAAMDELATTADVQALADEMFT